MYKTLFIIVLLLANAAYADNCDKPRDDFDGLYCLNKVYQESDNELNKAYKLLRTFLNKKEKKSLRKTQLEWINSRNNNCSIRKNGAFYVSLDCTTKSTVRRTNVILDRIRECKATGCQPSKL